MSTPATVYGLVIALIGFLLTRFTVTLAATDSSVEFLFAGIVPLVLGLSLAAFGVILAVGAYDVQFVRTTAVWCALGTTTMLFLVVLTVLGSQTDAPMNMGAARGETYLSNFLIGGAVGGTLTGLYAAQNRRQRVELSQQANRLVLLNRLLRDEVINAATAIKGHSDVLETEGERQSIEVIARQANDVIETVENVKYLSETADRSEQSLTAIDVGDVLERELAEIREAHPEAAVAVSGLDEAPEVRANAQLEDVLGHLLRNAVEYSETEPPELRVDVEATHRLATVRISDTGPGLPEAQRALLERGEIAEFDDPTTGFGLNIVRLLVESFDGEIRTTVSDGGSTVEVSLPRAHRDGAPGRTSTLSTPGVSPSRIGIGIVSSLVAGVAMWVAMVALGGDVPVIGALYGAENSAVAAISHEFHSVVFGLTFAAIVSALPATYTREAKHCLAVAVALGIVLWLVAAGLVMPVWLQLVGIDAALPNLGFPGFVGHVVWGGTLATLYHAGDRWLDRTGFDEDNRLGRLLSTG